MQCWTSIHPAEHGAQCERDRRGAGTRRFDRTRAEEAGHRIQDRRANRSKTGLHRDHRPELNPRFVLGLIRDVEIKPSPYWVQRRLRLAGIRPLNNIVDATNYAMLDQGEPLHAFDYDVLKARAGDKNVKIITRAARDGEKLTTIDHEERTLTSTNVLVCDEKGSLSIAGVMGGAESEVSDRRVTSCSKARPGTSSTSARRRNSTTCRPRRRSASRAACIRRWRRPA
jgi:phenylalanyl-tRNA synthetase beta subunit